MPDPDYLRASLVMGDFAPPSRGLTLARLAWLRYEVECERFDRTLPGRMSQEPFTGDAWIPHPAFHPEMNQHARERAAVRGLFLYRKAVPGSDSEAARREVQRMSFAEQERYLAFLEGTVDDAG